MAQRTLVENVAQAKTDFNTIAEVIQENDMLPLDTPTSEYAGMLKNIITKSFDDGVQAEIDLSKYIEKQASGKVIRLDDVSEVAHKVVVKADTPTEVKVYGKNLFNNDISLVKTVTYTNTSGTQTSRNGYEIHLPAGDYTATLISNEDTSSAYWYGVINDASGNFVRGVNLNQSTNNLTPISFIINEGDVLYWYDGWAERTIKQSWDLCFGLCQVQLEVGSVATPYEEFKEPQSITATPEGTETPSNCLTMAFLADNNVAVDYYGSYGMQTEYDGFWDNYQDYGKRTNYTYAFCQTGWTNTNFLPKYDITLTSAAQMFYYSKITDLAGILKKQGVVMDSSKATSVTYMYGYSSLTRIPITDLSSATNTTYFCAGNKGLVSIEKIIASEKTVFANNAFNNCLALEHCIFEGTIASDINLQWSPKLDLESLISLFRCINPFFGTDEAYTKTITLSAESWALTQTQEFLDEFEGQEGKTFAHYFGWNVA